MEKIEISWLLIVNFYEAFRSYFVIFKDGNDKFWKLRKLATF
jgi:hypothetical protein